MQAVSGNFIYDRQLTKDDYKFYIPYLGTLIILLGATKLTIYYSLFGINISSYLEFSEILTLFLSDLLFFIAIIFLQYLWIFLTQPKKELDNISQKLHNALTENNLLKRILAYAINGINLMLLISLWIIGIPFWLWLSELSFLTYLHFLYILFGVLALDTLIYETRRQWFVKFNEYPKIIYTNLARLFIVLLGLTISSAYQDYEAVKTNKKYLGTTLNLTDKEIISDSTYYYIGKTRNFVFFHDQNEQTNDIFPIREIKKLREKKNSR